MIFEMLALLITHPRINQVDCKLTLTVGITLPVSKLSSGRLMLLFVYFPVCV